MKQEIEQLVLTALEKVKAETGLTIDIPRVQVDFTKDKQFGDLTTNVALILAKPAARKPREMAEMIIKALPEDSQLQKVEIAGPGFINFFLAPKAVYDIVPKILTEGKNHGRVDIGKGKRILVEFVSSNPTGPLHVGHGRHAAYGAVVCDLLEAVGFSVAREYYVNDGGRQMDILAVSVWLRYLELQGETFTFPANAYKGGYVVDIAQSLMDIHGRAFLVPAEQVFDNVPLDEPEGGDKEIYIDVIIEHAKQLLGDKRYDQVFDYALKLILEDISSDLAEFGVTFDNWFSERDFVRTNGVDECIKHFKELGHIYEREGALWFRSTDFGDEKDRVIERANGQRTYFANDIAYHVNKMNRSDLSIDILGSDHHGYVPRIKACLAAYGIPAEKYDSRLVQFVTLYRGDTQVQMSTRSGSFVTLRELREEVGNDAARYFYVARKCEQHMDFDLELAKSKSNENPVFYVQYAHARICSVFRQLNEKSFTYVEADGLAHIDLLTEPHELQLMGTLSRYREVIANAATQYEPHILTNYLREVATDFHTYYNSHQFLVEDAKLRNARLALISAARQILINGLQLLGVSTPETM